MENYSHIEIKGARTNNLKSIDCNIKLNSITCFYGPSGSGKSSLAFHTIMTESKRRFMNSFPSDVKFFWDLPNTVDVDSIRPVLPVWGLSQYNPIVGSRPNAADIIGLSENFQKIFYVAGENHCPDHDVEYEQIPFVDRLASFTSNKEDDVYHCFIERAEYHKVSKVSMIPARSLDEDLTEISSYNEDDFYVELFRFKKGKEASAKKYLSELTLEDYNGKFLIIGKSLDDSKFIRWKGARECPVCHREEDVINSLEFFSPYNALGACDNCQGHGMTLEYDIKKLIKDDELSISEDGVSLLNYKRFDYLKPYFKRAARAQGFDLDKPLKKQTKAFNKFLYEGSGSYPGFNELFDYLESKRYKSTVRIFIRSLQTERLCTSCNGTRLNENVLSFTLAKSTSYSDIILSTFNSLKVKLEKLQSKLEKSIYWKNIKSNFSAVVEIVNVAIDLGLGDIKITQKAKTLSTGEYQRLLLVKYLSYKGNGSLFVLDEPSLGLSSSEQKSLLKYLKKLKLQGNTIVLVDHSEYLQQNSDEVILMGPGAGVKGGEILYQGIYKKEKEQFKPEYISKKIESAYIKIDDVYECSNDESLSYKFSAGQLTQVIGGASSESMKNLIHGFSNLLHYFVKGEKLYINDYKCKSSSIPKGIEDVIVFGTSPLRATSRSSVGTLIGLSPILRKYFSSLPVSKAMGLSDGHFSANSDLGKCSTCEGKGVKSVDMHFLEDLQFSCEDCKGMKLNPMYATISDGSLTVHEAFSSPLSLLENRIKMTPKVQRIFEYIKILNLDYLSLDRGLDTLSGGEKQRLKLLSSLQKEISNSVLVFENLSFGLSKRELVKIVELLHRLIDRNNTIILVDENEFFQKYVHNTIRW